MESEQKQEVLEAPFEVQEMEEQPVETDAMPSEPAESSQNLPEEEELPMDSPAEEPSPENSLEKMVEEPSEIADKPETFDDLPEKVLEVETALENLALDSKMEAEKLFEQQTLVVDDATVLPPVQPVELEAEAAPAPIKESAPQPESAKEEMMETVEVRETQPEEPAETVAMKETTQEETAKEAEPEKQEAEAVKEAEPEKPTEPVAVTVAEPEKPAEPIAVTEAEPKESTKDVEAEKVEAAPAAATEPEMPAEAAAAAAAATTEPEVDQQEGAGQEKAVEQQKEPEIPLFFGWFLLPEVQERLKCSTMDFLKTLDTLEAFKKHLSDFSGGAEKEVDLEQHFEAKGHLHCTAKFCNYSKEDGSKEYAEQEVVKESVGQKEELSVTALFVTPRVFGARVALTQEQMKLWPAGADTDGLPATLSGVDALPAGSRAHVTLGCAAGVESVQTGFDLLELLVLQQGGQAGTTEEEMELGSLSYLGEGRWYLALREAIAADATFTAYSEDKPSHSNGKKEGEKRKKSKCTIL